MLLVENSRRVESASRVGVSCLQLVPLERMASDIATGVVGHFTRNAGS